MIEANGSASRDAALRFLYSRIDYERSPAVDYSVRSFKLDRMAELLSRLGDPQQKLRIVHVAGTKGKGSTASMIAAILAAAGYRVGVFSSPHMFRVEERLAIDGQPCTAEEFVELVAIVEPHVRAMEAAAAMEMSQSAAGESHSTMTAGPASTSTCVDSRPTFFEIITAMALVHFARRQVEVAVMEVGMGGRLDSTNVCRPAVSVITSISYDHILELGPTLTHIASEKAGIIKTGVPVVSSATGVEARTVIRDKAEQERSPLWELDRDFRFDYRHPKHVERSGGGGEIDFVGPAGKTIANLRLRLVGRHQAANAAVALATIAQLESLGLTIGETAIRHGLAAVECPARVQVLARRPTVVIDAAHNVASAQALVDTLVESFSARRRFLIFATTREKDAVGMLKLLLPRFDDVILTRYVSNPRGMPPEELVQAAREANPVLAAKCRVISTPLPAWEAVQASATADDLICITGSFFLAADLHGAIINAR